MSDDDTTSPRSSVPQQRSAGARRRRLSATVGRRAGALTWCLIFANVLVFAFAHGNADALARYANSRSGILAGEYYRLVSAGFLHVSVLHLLVNMASLAIVGPQVEAHRGKTRFLGLYLLSVLAASTCSVVLSGSQSVGASGAVLGVAGAVFSTAVPHRRRLPLVVGMLAINLAVAATTPNIDVAGHLGGFVAGLVLGRVFGTAERRPNPAAREVPAAMAIGALLAGALIISSWGGARPEDETLRRVLEAQVAALKRQGIPYDTIKMQPPQLIPAYQVVADGRAGYTLYVLQDQHARRAVRLEFGDGSSATTSVAAGTGVATRRFTHRFPVRLSRFEQRAVLIGAEALSSKGITDVCPEMRTSRTSPGPTITGSPGSPPLCFRGAVAE